MLLEVVQKVSLYELLYRIDLDLCAEQRQKGCPHCGGPLHRAFYGRKPRGGPAGLPEEYCIRMGLSCGRPGCRGRTLPASCLFMGRRVYWGAVVLVVTALRQQRHAGASARKLLDLFEVSHKTLVRWMRYFREIFPSTAWWQRLRGRVSANVGNQALPASLLEHFMADGRDPGRGVIRCLDFLAVGKARG